MKLLLVEDNPADARLIREMLKELEAEGFQLQHVTRLAAAQERLRKERYDVALLDLGLADSQGMKTLTLAQEANHEVPIVVLTGFDDPAFAAEAVRAGAQDYLVKGRFDAALLARTIRYAIERKRSEEEVRRLNAELESRVVERTAQLWASNEELLKEIAERKQTDAALAKERENLQTIFDVVNVGLFLVDEKGAVERVNDTVSKWAGKDLTASLGAQPGDLVGCIHALSDTNGCGHTAHCASCPIRNAFESVLRAGQPVHGVETEATLSVQGKLVNLWLEASADPLDLEGKRHVLLALNNITTRKQAEEALRASEERYRTLFKTMLEGFCIIEMVFDTDGRPVDYRFLETNPAFEKQTGLKNAQGRLMRELAPAIEPYWFEIYGKVALTGEPTRFQNEAKALNRWYDVSAYRVGGPESRKVAIVFNDATRRKQMLDALRRLNASLEQRVAQRTAETRQLADELRALAAELGQAEQRERKRLAGILHDHIQQLLVAAQMQLSVVKRADRKTVESTVQGVGSIIKEAIDASRSLATELSPPIPHQAGLAPALGWLASRMEEKSLFKVHVQASSDAEPAGEAVRLFLFEAVRELLLNAVKHSGVREAWVTMARAPDGWTKIIVEDKGKGFDPEVLKSRKGGGFGIFSILHRLAYLGGRLELESAPGRGTRATLSAPPGKALETGEAGAPATAGEEAVRFVRKGKKISVLLADDHAIVRQGLASTLQFEPDMEVAGEAANGREAVALARERRPDVVIMDVNMPVMNGVEATRIIVREMPESKVIAFSMHTDPDVASAMGKAGAVGYLTKGGPSEELIAAIRACGRH